MLKLFLNLSFVLTVLSWSWCILHIFVWNHINLAIHNFICTVLTSLCVETLLSSLDMKMRILWCTTVCVYVKVSLFPFMIVFRVQTQGVPPSWKWLQQEWDQAWERGSEGQSKKGKRGGNHIHKRSWLFSKSLSRHHFCPSLLLSFSCIAMCVLIWAREKKRSGQSEEFLHMPSPSLRPEQWEENEEWYGHEWENILAIFYGAAD